MTRTYRWDDKQKMMIEVTPKRTSDVHYVQPDFEPFQSPDQAVITSRTQWREHLKATDSVEFGHSDMKAQQESWNKRQAAHAERVDRAKQFVKEYDKPQEVREYKRSNLNVEMANKLHGRPTPNRIEMIKLTMETAKEMQRRGR